ncbi:MAG: FAD-binding oxidoreductase [Streptosporangiaceae bacterium]
MDKVDRRDFLLAGSAAAGLAALAGARAGRSETADAARRAPLDQLRRKLRGRLLVPGEPGYEAASAPANGRYDAIRPLAVAVCADEHDVVSCVDWARRYRIRPVARGGGHSYAGFSTTSGLLIDLGRFSSVRIDAASGTATLGGGTLNGDLFRALKGGHLFLPVGTCLGVGAGGLTLGGGIGYNTRWAGLTCDHLRSSRIVTAAGDVLDIDAARHGELYWACRGGAGGSFGINTSFTFDLLEVPRKTVSYYLAWWRGAEAATGAFVAFDEILRNAPAAFNAVLLAQAAPVGPAGPREAMWVWTRGQYVGPLDELRDLIRPMLEAAGKPAELDIREVPFWAAQQTFADAPSKPHSFGDISRYAARPLPQHAVQQMIDLVARCPSRAEDAHGSIWNLGWVGGDVVDSVPRTATAYVHRGMMTLFRPTTVWPSDAPRSVGRGLVEWSEEMMDVLRPHTPDESYQNFPNRLISDWQREYYGENFRRLVRVKSRYDPHDLFRNQQSIPPGRPAGRHR